MTAFVAQRLIASAKCQLCATSLVKASDDINNDREKFINIKNRGYLLKPSDSFFKLVKVTEDCVLETIQSQTLSIMFLNNILFNLESKKLAFVGCVEHSIKFTNTVIQYFLVLRMCFICKGENEIDHMKKKKGKDIKNYQNYKKAAQFPGEFLNLKSKRSRKAVQQFLLH